MEATVYQMQKIVAQLERMEKDLKQIAYSNHTPAQGDSLTTQMAYVKGWNDALNDVIQYLETIGSDKQLIDPTVKHDIIGHCLASVKN